MAVSLLDALLQLYPTAVVGVDFTLRNDGEGDFIDTWSLKGAEKPSAKVLAQAADAAAVAAAKDAAIDAVEASCAAAVVGGFICSALGAPYTYPTKATDQANMQARTLAALINATTKGWKTQFWCADAAGVWAYRDHTSAQMQEVGQAGDAWIGSCIAKKIVKEALITAATTAQAALAITWDSDDAAEPEAAAGAAA